MKSNTSAISIDIVAFKKEFKRLKRNGAKPLSSFERVHAQAEQQKRHQWAQIKRERQELGRDWWRDQDLWNYPGPYISRTEGDAIRAIFQQCGGTYVSVWETAVAITQELLQEDVQRRVDRIESDLVDLLADRGLTLEFTHLNPGDKHLTVFVVPLKHAS